MDRCPFCQTEITLANRMEIMEAEVKEKEIMEANAMQLHKKRTAVAAKSATLQAMHSQNAGAFLLITAVAV